MDGSKLPWWIGFPASVGFTLMGIFAPSLFPQWVQVVCFFIGAVFAAWGVSGAIWHYRPIWQPKVAGLVWRRHNERPSSRDSRSTTSAVSGKKPASGRQLEPEWGKLFGASADGKTIHLRFLPDTGKDVEADALLLILFGYRLLMGVNAVRASTVRMEVARAFREAPNASLVTKFAPSFEFFRVLANEDLGSGPVARHELRRTRLTEGGFYELTDIGLSKARMLAIDLIERA